VIKALKRVPGHEIEIDHYGQPGRGTEAEYKDVLALGKLRSLHVGRAAESPNAARMVRMVYDAFGPDRLMWAGYGGICRNSITA